MKKSILQNTLFLFTSLFCFHYMLAQEPINVIESNQLEQIILNDTTFQKFSGNVTIEYSDYKISCDTILIDEYRKLIRGWGNTFIYNDTINCSSDSINITQKNNKISFYENSLIKTNNMTIIGDKINYNYETEIINYSDNGKVINSDEEINSKKFTYDIKKNKSTFKDDIIVIHPKYHIIAEHIKIQNDTINFLGKTQIKDKDFTINCNKGYLKKENTLKLSNGVKVEIENKIITSKNFKRDIKKDINNFNNNVHVKIDSNTYIFGENLKHSKKIYTVTKNCKMTLLNSNDSTVILGDKIILNEENEVLEINENIIIKGNNIEGKCNKIKFLSDYTKILMIQKPVLWLNTTQLTGKEIKLKTIKNDLDSIFIDANPFIIYPNDSIKYHNQIKGKTLNGKFDSNQIESIHIRGNGQMKYFESHQEEKDKININNIEASNIKLTFSNNQIKTINCVQNVESNHIELKKVDLLNNNDKSFYLEGFRLINRSN